MKLKPRMVEARCPRHNHECDGYLILGQAIIQCQLCRITFSWNGKAWIEDYGAKFSIALDVANDRPIVRA